MPSVTRAARRSATARGCIPMISPQVREIQMRIADDGLRRSGGLMSVRRGCVPQPITL